MAFIDVTTLSSQQAVEQDSQSIKIPIRKRRDSQDVACEDWVAIEEPLQIVVRYGPESARIETDLAITMRTPGNDLELAVGFLLSEGLLEGREQLALLPDHYSARWEAKSCNRVVVELNPEVRFDPRLFQRHFFVSSSCGVCGKRSIELLQSKIRTEERTAIEIVPALIHSLPTTLREYQSTFEKTGGLHAAALFDTDGTLISVREDVGRHNAVDKVVGTEFLADRLPLRGKILLLSGRASFELVQKALMSGISIVASVGAPSSLAVSLADRFNLTLIGFLRQNSFNVYASCR